MLNIREIDVRPVFAPEERLFRDITGIAKLEQKRRE
jgi:hypothetical protein